MKSIRTKIIMILNGISILSILLIGSYFVYDLVQENHRQSDDYRTSLEVSTDRGLKTQVETVVSAINSIYREQQAGKLTEEQAKLQAANLVRNLRYDKDSYFWIDTAQGVNVVLLGREVEGKSRLNDVDTKGVSYIKDMVNNGLKDGGGFTNYSFPKPGEKVDLPKRAYTVAFKPYNWVIGTGVWIDYIDNLVAEHEKVSNENLRRNLLFVFGVMFFVQLIVMCLAIYIAKYVAAPISAATARLNLFASGDFTDTGASEFVHRNDEFGEMSKAFAVLNKTMNDLIKQIANSAEQVASASEELTASADQSALVSSQVADSITDVAHASHKQVEAVEETSAVVEELSASLQEVAVNATLSADQAIEATETAKEGSKNVDNAVNQMNLIEKAVNNSAEVVTQLGERSKQIGTIVDTIAGIAGQTNLLALNAAIEAARAGAQGRGFAVVAEEVRKLAEQSQDAAKQIAELIGEIQKDTDQAVVTMNQGTKEVSIGTEVVINAGHSFIAIAKLVETVAGQTKGIANTINEMASGTERIVGSVQDIDTMCKSVSDEAQNVSAATEEQTASMNEIATASQSLATMAQELQVSIQKFRV
ncbi:MAG: chemotaxis protein [Firmicutes bacterium]|nr:chemotaxis protein [Bacillota bacterium]